MIIIMATTIVILIVIETENRKLIENRKEK